VKARVTLKLAFTVNMRGYEGLVHDVWALDKEPLHRGSPYWDHLNSLIKLTVQVFRLIDSMEYLHQGFGGTPKNLYFEERNFCGIQATVLILTRTTMTKFRTRISGSEVLLIH
jgi:hypothetical protein